MSTVSSYDHLSPSSLTTVYLILKRVKLYVSHVVISLHVAAHPDVETRRTDVSPHSSIMASSN